MLACPSHASPHNHPSVTYMASRISLELGAGCLRWAPTSAGGSQLPQADHLETCVHTFVRGKPQLQHQWGSSEVFWAQMTCGHQKHAIWPAVPAPDSSAGRLARPPAPVKFTFLSGRGLKLISARTGKFCMPTKYMRRPKTIGSTFAIRRFDRKAASSWQENEMAWLPHRSIKWVWLHAMNAICHTHTYD